MKLTIHFPSNGKTLMFDMSQQEINRTITRMSIEQERIGLAQTQFKVDP